jgi:hemoglobin
MTIVNLRSVFASTLLLLSMAGVCAETTPPSTSRDDALYQALGGQNGISQVVDDLVSLVLLDSRIKDSFKDTNMRRLAELLKEQFCVLSGGPCKYSGDDMVTVHEKLGINMLQFNALTEDLQLAMEKNSVPSSVQNKLIAKLAPMQRDIVRPGVQPQ